MADSLQCSYCGADLASLTLPISRQDQCPECSRYLHVCRMCKDFDPAVPKQCREDDAEEVMDKDKPNFCDWFRPAPGRYRGGNKSASAERQLAALFGESDEGGDDDDAARKAAEDLFR